MKPNLLLPGLLVLGLAGLAHAPAYAQDFGPGVLLQELLAISDGAAQAPGAEEADKTVFAQCQPCHSVDGSNGVGPSLKGVAGRKAGTYPDFRYSRAMMGAPVMWDSKTLNAFITEPQRVVPGTVMPFPGLPDAAQRAALVAYLQTLK